MADVPVDVGKLNGNFREQYADDIEILTPSGILMQRDIPFVEASQRPGNQYHQPVVLTHEHGFTYAAAGAGAFSLNDAIAGQMKDAYLNGTQMLLKTQIDYEVAARASSGPPRNFKQAVGIVVENMWASSKKRAEIDILWGQMSLGKISAINHTTGVITITTAEWAPGIWAGQEGAIINAFDGVGATATAHEGDLTITAVNLANRTVTVSGTNTTVAVGDYLWFKTQRTATAHNVFAGMHKILANAGSLFGVDASQYSLWAAETYPVGGALSFSKIQKAVAQAMGKGLDEDVTLYIHPGGWADLLTDEAALRRHVKGGSKEALYYAGASGLEFFSQNGMVRIKASIYMKEGYAMLISPKLWKRIGATDLTFRLPDRGDEFFRHVDTKACYELRNYINHSVFCKAPGKNVLLTGIVNSA